MGSENQTIKAELKRLFHDVNDFVMNEIKARFTDCNSDVMCVLSDLKSKNKDVFHIPAKIAPHVTVVWNSCSWEVYCGR